MPRPVVLLSLIVFFAIPSTSTAQNFFEPILDIRELPQDAEAGRHYFKVDFPGLWSWIQNSPAPELILPTEHSTTRFQLQQTAVLAPELAKKYPDIRTYLGKSGSMTLHCVITPNQFSAYLDDGTITQLLEGDTRSASLGKLSAWMGSGETFPCTVLDGQGGKTTGFHHAEDVLETRDPLADQVLRTYRLAVATTGEFSAKYGNTRTSVMTEVVSIITKVNAVMERDLSINLQLVDGTDQLFFLNPQTDPFTNGSPDSLLLQAPFAINAVINTNNYDIGHVFGTNAGGVAFLGTVCTAGKANATSSTFGAYSNSLFYLIVAHEMGHQLNATHSFNFCDGENESSETAYEPGSGSTIMCYAGASNCGSNYVASRNEDYYHNIALNQIITFTRQGIGATCGSTAPISNTSPQVSILDIGFTHIPKSTPFQLRGEATDNEDSDLTYCWEEYNLGPQSALGEPKGDAPAFRSYPPTSDPVRTLPNLTNYLLGLSSKTEVLPDYSRNLKFRLTVRDNHAGGGLASWQELSFKVDGNAGPFRVTGPGSGATWENNQYQLVTWDVANTDNSQVNCQKVRILLSTDGGHNHPIVLKDVTENDGSEYVLIPAGIETSAANIKVEAINNVFFNLSPGTFKIQTGTTETWSFGITPNSLDLCIPGSESIVIDTKSSNGFQDPITITWPGQLPEGIMLDADQTTVQPDETINLTLTAAYQTIYQDTSIMLTLQSGNDERTIPVYLHLTPSDFSALALSSPADGATGQSSLPRLTWQTVPDADYYWVEVSNDPGFTSNILQKLSYTNFYDVTSPLSNSSVYYWRITPANSCRSGEPSAASAFQTKTQTCQEYTNSTPVIGGRQAESVIAVPMGIIPTDVNVLNLKGTWQLVGNLTFTLVNPLDSSVILAKGKCSNLSNFDFGFDDQSSTLLSCPLSSQKIFKPENPLSKLNGLPAGGDWKLRITDNGGNSGGSIDQWTLALCFDDVLNPPVLIGSDTLLVMPSISTPLNPDLLTVSDGDQSIGDLQVTLLQEPVKGELRLNNQILAVGSQMTLLQLLDGSSNYTFTSPEAGLDSVVVSIQDGHGGWIPRATIYFRSDAGVAIKHLEELTFQLYPNPAVDRLHLEFTEVLNRPVMVLIDALGRNIWQRAFNESIRSYDVSLTQITPGIYFFLVKTADKSGIKKIMIQAP
ncbi:MAG: T9SS type A sorting domain-containing protein [Saprospiraceae bacterium]|nr:T9SS type A sorting domain-containing protein [Saprospiraceae bacterium]MCB9318202.1 T9SS type A sorting domain-containing protein [Lewinellaceae bacterium]